MTRITYKTVENTLVNRKQLTLNDKTYIVTIDVLNFNVTVSSDQFVVYSQVANNVPHAKKLAKETLTTLGFVFGTEKRTKTTQEQAA